VGAGLFLFFINVYQYALAFPYPTSAIVGTHDECSTL